jgi:hypothetical protein
MTQPTPRKTLALIAVPAAVLLAGCGGSSRRSTHNGAATPAASATASTPTRHATPAKARQTLAAAARHHPARRTHSAPSKLAQARAHAHHHASTPPPSLPKSSDSGSGANPSLKSTGKPPAPASLDASLERLIARQQPAIKDATVRCPAASRYPLTCTLAGRARLPGPKPTVAITGTVTVLGIDNRTHSYDYEVEYRPARK